MKNIFFLLLCWYGLYEECKEIEMQQGQSCRRTHTHSMTNIILYNSILITNIVSESRHTDRQINITFYSYIVFYYT